ncbi:MAG: hypothetical protein A2355_18410 [Spirochaetes bacterium RIFOXYB1_FULL_32_8]|nr:MAG: hypothetical protein A2Y29_02655 [Spirochaetes bacterium GWE2_31_10]OHD82200.1 MAG: hypothetical protein A2355_18410 [Spirochaetes bacterium RIFOXYB1_FULL_32_8]HBI36309.1 hypothetical protein [Spirochaetia bacterium]
MLNTKEIFVNKNYFIILLLVFFTFSMFSKTNDEVTAPKNVKLISQSCTQLALFLTVIDLDNKEIVILEYQYKVNGRNYYLSQVIRTGMFATPDQISFFKGTDAPYLSDNEG